MGTDTRARVGWWALPHPRAEAHLLRDTEVVAGRPVLAYCGTAAEAWERVQLMERRTCGLCTAMLHHLIADHGGVVLSLPIDDGGLRQVDLRFDGDGR